MIKGGWCLPAANDLMFKLNPAGSQGYGFFLILARDFGVNPAFVVLVVVPHGRLYCRFSHVLKEHTV